MIKSRVYTMDEKGLKLNASKTLPTNKNKQKTSDEVASIDELQKSMNQSNGFRFLSQNPKMQSKM
jgi:hypothetical protein